MDKTPLKQSIPVWIICAVAIWMSAASLWVAALHLFKAMHFDWEHVQLSAFAALVTAVSAGLIHGALQKRPWAIWPALFLFVLFFPLILVELYQSFFDPPFPHDGFASEGHSMERNHILWEQKTKTEFWADEYKRRFKLFGWLLVVALPVISVKYLRRKGKFN